MAYANFTDALMQAKRASQLRGIPFSTADVQNLQAGYMEGASERANAEKSSALAEENLALGNNTLAAQKENWAANLAQEKQIASDQQNAAEKASQKQLYGNAISTGASLGGAALMANSGPAPSAGADVLGTWGSWGGGAPAVEAGTGAADALTGTTGGYLAGETTAAGAGAGGSASGASAGPIAAMIAAAMLNKDVQRQYARGGEREKGGIEGYYANASQTPVNSVLTPGQALVDAGLIGKDTAVGQFVGLPGKLEQGIMDAVGDLFGCIIITACTSPDSPEVNTARKYRDAHMDKMELRGYYAIAEKVVPLMGRFRWFKRLVKRILVNGIIDYCEYATGTKTVLPRKWSAIITKSFLGFCGYVGSRLVEYVRKNGEVF